MDTSIEEILINARRIYEWTHKLENKLVDPIDELMDMEDKIADLEAKAKSLSDTLAEKEHKIMDLEADKERLTRTWGNELRMNGKIRKELREYKTKCAKQEAAIRCKDAMIIELANKYEKHANMLNSMKA